MLEGEGSRFICANGNFCSRCSVHCCAGHGVSLGSYEYLVYEKVFVAVAAEFGLQPVTSYALAEEGFQPQYHDHRQLHDLLEQVSCSQLAACCRESLTIFTGWHCQLFCAFAFSCLHFARQGSSCATVDCQCIMIVRACQSMFMQSDADCVLNAYPFVFAEQGVSTLCMSMQAPGNLFVQGNPMPKAIQ